MAGPAPRDQNPKKKPSPVEKKQRTSKPSAIRSGLPARNTAFVAAFMVKEIKRLRTEKLWGTKIFFFA
jgi:hypothetical protein